MTAKETCPKCGAKETSATTDRTLIRYLCNSMVKNGEFYKESQSDRCRIAELEKEVEIGRKLAEFVQELSELDWNCSLNMRLKAVNGLATALLQTKE